MVTGLLREPAKIACYKSCELVEVCAPLRRLSRALVNIHFILIRQLFRYVREHIGHNSDARLVLLLHRHAPGFEKNFLLTGCRDDDPQGSAIVPNEVIIILRSVSAEEVKLQEERGGWIRCIKWEWVWFDGWLRRLEVFEGLRTR